MQKLKLLKKRGAGAADATPEAKKMRSSSPIPEHQLAITDAATAVVRPPAASPSSRNIDTPREGSPSSPVRLGGLSLTEGSRRYVTWLGQEVSKLEGEKSRSDEQLKASRAKLGRANAEVKALKANLAAQAAQAAEEAAEVERLRSELAAAKGQLRAAKDGQGEVLKMYTKRLLLSDQFTELARDLAELVNGDAILDAIEEIGKANPGLDTSKCGYQRLEGPAVCTQYAKVVRRHLDHLPLLNELASSSALLTAEMVASCSTDRDAELDAAFDALSGEDMEVDVEVEGSGAGVEEGRAEQAPSSSGAAEAVNAVEGVSVGEQPLSEKEVGDS